VVSTGQNTGVSKPSATNPATLAGPPAWSGRHARDANGGVAHKATVSQPASG
jgi:hypothetical protein